VSQVDRLRSPHSLRVKLLRLAWAAVEMTLFRLSFHTMSGWRSFLLRRFGAKVGRRSKIRRSVRVYYPWNLVIGELCIIGDDVRLYDLGQMTIGDRVMISQEAYLCAGTHDHTDPALPLLTPPITIGADAWICARAFIGPGVSVGQGAIVAACGVAVKDVEPWTIVGGNPAKFIGKRVLGKKQDTSTAFHN
jgi:putative colanic acid biosynthesis acetyltransferase WcaF